MGINVILVHLGDHLLARNDEENKILVQETRGPFDEIPMQSPPRASATSTI